MTPEFSRPVRLDTLGAAPRRIEIEADEGERAALAERFALPAIDRLSAQVSLTGTGEAVAAKGILRAEVIQSCVATGDPVHSAVEEAFEIEFRPAPDVARPEEEIELGDSELDVTFYEGVSIDVGEAVAETLALAIDPFPRSPTAEEALRQAGVKSEAEARAESSAFAVLTALKEKLEE
jgi:uncharacterized metal-binding protein YceD (DUF177 family)